MSETDWAFLAGFATCAATHAVFWLQGKLINRRRKPQPQWQKSDPPKRQRDGIRTEGAVAGEGASVVRRARVQQRRTPNPKL